MNTHTLYNHCRGYFQLSVYYSSKFTHCIHPLWSRGNPHHLAANPHLHSYCLTGFYPSWNTGHSWFLRCCVHKLHFCLGHFFSGCTWWSLIHSLRDEHATWSTLVFAPASPSQRRTPLLTQHTGSTGGPLNGWMGLSLRVCPVFLERACAKSDKLSVCVAGEVRLSNILLGPKRGVRMK